MFGLEISVPEKYKSISVIILIVVFFTIFFFKLQTNVNANQEKIENCNNEIEIFKEKFDNTHEIVVRTDERMSIIQEDISEIKKRLMTNGWICNSTTSEK